MFTAVLTRPAGQSAGLAARLARDGMAVLEFPLIGISAVEDDAPRRAALAARET
jgi:uroporphyrinogen III methyltransferase/synthase